MQLWDAAMECCENYHKGQRFKYVEGPYHQHPKAVAAQMRGLDVKVLAILHDVVEDTVKKRWGKHLTPSGEELMIKMVLCEIDRFFKARGHRLDATMMQDLDILTRRSHMPYAAYIRRIKRHVEKTGRRRVALVKIGDLKDNQRRDRNPPPNSRTPKDKERLRRYAEAEENLIVFINRGDIRKPSDQRSKSFKRQPKPMPQRESVAHRLSNRYGDIKHG